MLTQNYLEFNPNYHYLIVPVEAKASILELELAQRSLRNHIFGSFESAELAELVAGTMISMLRVSLMAGSLEQFKRQVDWEIHMALLQFGTVKLEKDLEMVVLLETILNEHLGPDSREEIRDTIQQIRTMYENCWQEAQLHWQPELHKN